MARDGVPTYDKEWASLTSEQRAAAQCLGYTRRTWSNDSKVAADDKDWKQLTKAQQAAATTLGYTQQSWDEDSDNDS